MNKLIDLSKKTKEIILSKRSRKEVADELNIDEEDVRAYRRLLKTKVDKSYKKGIALFDIHYPDHDEKAIDIAYQFTKDFQPDIFVLGGDQMDMNCISYYNRGKPKLVENQRLIKVYKEFQKDILDRFESVLLEDTKKHFLKGNHEFRVDRRIEGEPNCEGFIEVENNLKLDDWNVIEYNGILKMGKMNIIHGNYVNKYHANKHLTVYNDNIYYGHMHNSQSFAMQTPLNNEPREAQGVGCMCNKNPHYKRNMPNAWMHEFLYFYLMLDGSYYPYKARIMNGMSVINGKVYEG